jgi:hypothetical protein
VIAGLERFTRHTLTAELTGSPPLDAPPLHGTRLVRRFHGHERMRVPKLEGNDISFDLYCFVLEVCRRERVMAVHLDAARKHCGGEE